VLLWALEIISFGTTQAALIDTLLVVVIVAVASGLVGLVSRMK
jgi:preprotein translocase subunit SecE